ncbi:chitinase domain-containing protein 1 isoform X2 [Pteropus medius]|uniref:chitinase domain-containing protein 1 isoform X2 n=1 Tax=Pteropus vampyrus TaxID=132908 RepID=UPI00196A8D45|nr:chitinase domain-containing protein 1 isoform X2 [Pteropus giganteus]
MARVHTRSAHVYWAVVHFLTVDLDGKHWKVTAVHCTLVTPLKRSSPELGPSNDASSRSRALWATKGPLNPKVGPCCDMPAMKALLGTLWLALACGSVHTTLSKSDAKKAASKTLLEKTQPSEKPVQDRGLVVTDPRPEDVVLEHRSYCSAKARERHFAGDILGYVTPWNSHGYDVAKVFGGKFTQISPVWLQLKRRGREMFEVTGLHDVDQGWMRAVRKQGRGLRIVPRLLFEDWTREDFRRVWDSEDEIEELSKAVVQVARDQHFDGFVVEVWSQLLSQKHMGLIHMLTHMAEALHQARLLAILVIPPAVTPGTEQLGVFTHKEFEQLAPVLDGFSLMTYDYPAVQQPGPNAPLSWVRACVQVLDPKAKWRSKILLGLNFYGTDYSTSRDARESVVGARPCPTVLPPGTSSQRGCTHGALDTGTVALSQPRVLPPPGGLTLVMAAAA